MKSNGVFDQWVNENSASPMRAHTVYATEKAYSFSDAVLNWCTRLELFATMKQPYSSTMSNDLLAFASSFSGIGVPGARIRGILCDVEVRPYQANATPTNDITTWWS